MAILSGELFSACLSWLFGGVDGIKKTNDDSMATSAWVGVSGDWSTPADWSTNSVPGPSDVAAIDAAGNYRVMVSTLESIGSVCLNDPGAILDIQPSGTLEVSGPLVVQSGALDIQGSGYGLPGGALAISGSLSVQSGGALLLDGGAIEGGSLVIGQGGALEVSPGLPIPGEGGGVLQDVTVLGGLTLNGGALWLSGDTTIENSNGSGPGAITLNGSSTYLALGENYTFDDLFLNGGYVAGDGTAATIEKGGLVRGYGGFIYGPFGPLTLDNEGTINSNVNGQWLNISEMPFVNNGLVLASGGGNISIDYPDPNYDPWGNGSDGIISAINGGTLQLGSRFTNFGLISAVNSTVDFGDPVGPPSSANNAGKMFVLGGALNLGDSYFSDSWTNSGLIATVGAAIDVLGSGTISAGGTLSVLGGTLSGQTTLEDDGHIRLGGGSIALSSLTIDAGGQLSGFGAIANPIASSGIIDASVGKLNLGDAITGNGQLQISRGATLELGGDTAEAVTFEAKHGTLLLDNTNDFSGTVAGMAHRDAIDLANFAFSTDPSITNVAGTGAAGSITDVTVSDGSLTATLQLLNHSASQYPVDSSAYSLTSDHHGSANAGTLFTLAPSHMC